MPTYSYICDHCKHTFDVFQKMSDKHTEECPKCKKKPRRLISNGIGVIFKGSGWTPKHYK